MKRHAFRIIIALLTFIAGIIATAAWFAYRLPLTSIPSKPVTNVSISSSKVISETEALRVKFCDLIHDPKRYDRQIVRIKAIYVTGIDSASLYSPTCNLDVIDNWVKANCLPVESCEKISNALNKFLPDQRWMIKAEVDVIGRFYAYGEGNQHRFVMLDVKDAKPEDSATR